MCYESARARACPSSGRAGGGGGTPGTGSYITNVPWVNSSVFNALTSACVCEHLSHEPHPASCNKTRVMPRPSQREVVSCKAAKGAGTRGYNPKNVPTRTPDLLGGACSNSSSQLQRTYDKYLLFLKTDSSKRSGVHPRDRFTPWDVFRLCRLALRDAMLSEMFFDRALD